MSGPIYTSTQPSRGPKNLVSQSSRLHGYRHLIRHHGYDLTDISFVAMRAAILLFNFSSTLQSVVSDSHLKKHNITSIFNNRKHVKILFAIGGYLSNPCALSSLSCDDESCVKIMGRIFQENTFKLNIHNFGPA